MDYNPPTGSTDPDAAYVGKTSSTQGSKVPRGAIEYPQRELVHLIEDAGLDPTNTDMTQVAQAVAKKIGILVPSASLVHAGTNTGTANALVATVAPPITSYVAGSLYLVEVSAPNAGAATADLGFGAKLVLRSNGLPLQANDISNTAALVWNGAAFILLNLAQDIPVPGSGFAGNQARPGFSPTTGTPYVLTATFTAPTAGVVSAFSTLNSSPSNQNITNSVSINGTSGASDNVSGSSISIANLAVAKGASVTVTSTVTATQGATYAVAQYLNYSFIPA